jgi:hypothetical protein
VRSRGARAAVLAIAVAAVVVLFAVLSGGDDEGGGDVTNTTGRTTQAGGTGPTGSVERERPKPKPRPAAERVLVEGGKPVGGVKRLSYESGERVRFIVRSDVADEIHVHGYDISRDVQAGDSVRFGFPAKLEGVFEVELEQRHEQIAQLRVNP